MSAIGSKAPWIKRLLLTAVLVPLTLLWGEVFTRILLPQNVDSKMNIFAADPLVGFTYKPLAKTYEKGKEYNALYQINSLGLRDREYGAKKKGVFRVLLLGDSFSVSHGLPIEDSLSRQMERALQGAADTDGRPITFEVINASAGGYSPYNYWRAYDRWAPVFQPDAVLVGLSPDDYDCENDNASYWIEDGEILAIYRDRQSPTVGRNLSATKLRKWLAWNSEFYVLMRNYFYYSELVGRISQRTNPGGARDNSQFQLYMVSQRESMRKAWEKSFSYLRKLQRDAAEDGIPLVLMPIPLKMEIDAEQYRQILASQGLKSDQVDPDQHLKEINEFCRRENIPVLDPREAMRQRHVETPCYFVYDGHWVAEGVRTATASAASQWRSMGLPPWDHAAN